MVQRRTYTGGGIPEGYDHLKRPATFERVGKTALVTPTTVDLVEHQGPSRAVDVGIELINAAFEEHTARISEQSQTL